MTVKLHRKNAKYPDLTQRQPYVVIGIEADDYRILNDAGRPYLYPRAVFQVVDAREPEDWLTSTVKTVSGTPIQLHSTNLAFSKTFLTTSLRL